MDMKIINLTAHDVTLLTESGIVDRVFKPSGAVARVQQDFETFGEIESDGTLKVVRASHTLNFDGATLQPYCIYIVSWIFLQALRDVCHPNLHQFVAPNTNGMEKDERGAVRGVKNFLVLRP